MMDAAPAHSPKAGGWGPTATNSELTRTLKCYFFPGCRKKEAASTCRGWRRRRRRLADLQKLPRLRAGSNWSPGSFLCVAEVLKQNRPRCCLSKTNIGQSAGADRWAGRREGWGGGGFGGFVMGGLSHIDQ